MRLLVTSTLASTLVAIGIGVAASLAPTDVQAGGSWRHHSPPPAARYEAQPSAKRGHHWVPGYWSWSRNQYVWVGGHWVRHRPGYQYHAPHWRHHNGYYSFYDGRWSRYRDSDGDGVPNRYDRRPRDPSRY
jgi:hypothetical protein